MIKENIEKRASRGELSVVMPVYNEAGIIEKVIEHFHRHVIRQRPGSRLIVIEDGSDDGTKDILKSLNRRIPFTLISAEKRKGYTRAFKDALKTADTELIFFSDSDGQHNPRDVFKMLREIGGFDIVGGYKHPRRDPLYRRWMSRM